ncbi:WYL domain-containing protein [Fodinibius sp.]|uniref:helix-turn-helix transcriptional regulator n=1 Tax=Fodinibius sp. TaxID=1872440 RepID=UPI002ACE4F3F|nr:WYL domain-containing protein [Fodinibius sp.]MDZ7659407.1 WYL domain-containing protein [Fodinibius sp.]
MLVFYRDHWNVIGYSHKRDDERNFLLDRMSKIQILDEDFVPYGKIDVEGLIFRSDGSSQKVIVDVSESTLKRFQANLPANILKKNKIKPNLFRIEFMFDNMDFINKWLLQFPKDVEIISPDILIEKRSDLLHEMIDKQNN